MDHATPPATILGRVSVPLADTAGLSLLEDFTPIGQALEARLTSEHWRVAGLQSFLTDEVPYVINNSGWAPEAAAAVLHAGFSQRKGPIRVLELGAGIGLFARQVLDAVKRLSLKEGTGLYQRLDYLVTDGSEATCEAWRRSGQFLDHGERVRIGHIDATDLRAALGDEAPFQLIIANYLLDSLPTAVARHRGEQIEQLCLQTWLPYPEHELPARTGRSLMALRALVSSGDLAPLAPLAASMLVRVGYRSEGAASVPWVSEVLDRVPQDIPAPVNHGALSCLTEALRSLSEDGALLFTDYGPTRVSEFGSLGFAQRFGQTISSSINFAMIDSWFQDQGHEVYVAHGDEQRTIHTRLLCRAEAPSLLWQTFLASFGDPRLVSSDRNEHVLTGYINGGQYDDALAHVRAALAYCPSDWYLLAYASQFLCQQLGRYAEAEELAAQAVRINPWHSAFAYNTLGNARYCLGRHDDAAAAFERAQEISPTDPQTQLNLAFLHQFRGQLEAALICLAKGLAGDQRGLYRDTLLTKQSQVLAELAQRRGAQAERRRERDALLRKVR